MSKKLKFGIIGCRMGLSHALGLRACNGGELVAICDTNEEILAGAEDTLGLAKEDSYIDYRDLLKRDDIDVIIVASPDSLHLEHTVKSLEAGKHVLCEKPMAMTLGECREMIDTSERTGKKLMVGQICRYAPGFMKAKELIDEGEIGELFFVESEYAHDYSLSPGVDNWRKDPKRLREPALGGGCHAVDLLRWIAGDPYEVSAYSNRKVLKDWPVDDCTIGIMKFPKEVLGKVMVSIGCKRNYTMRSVFYGTQGTIIADNQSNFITVYREQIGQDERLFNGVRDQVLGIQHPVSINHHNTTGEINEFIDIILNDRPVNTDGVQGASTVQVCLAMIESAANGGQNIAIEYDF